MRGRFLHDVGGSEEILEGRLTQHFVDGVLHAHPQAADRAVDRRVVAGVSGAYEVVAEGGVVQTTTEGGQNFVHYDGRGFSR